MNCILTKILPVGYVKKNSQEYTKAVMSNVKNISYDFNQNELIVDMGKGLKIKLYKLEPYPFLRGYHTLQGDKSVERFDHMFVCRFQASL